MITISNSVFDVQGASKKDSVYGITLSGAEDIMIQNCEFKNQGYSAILNRSTGNVTIQDCTFKCDTMYNPIEGGQSADNGNVTVANCEFTGTPGNNFVNFYQFADGSAHKIVGCTFTPTTDNNIIRISNRTSAKAKFDVKDCAYNFTSGEVSEYTGFILCQDYTNKSGVKQDFTGLNINIENVTCDGEKLTSEGAAKGSIYYVYEDGAGVITGENDPVVVVR